MRDAVHFETRHVYGRITHPNFVCRKLSSLFFLCRFFTHQFQIIDFGLFYLAKISFSSVLPMCLTVIFDESLKLFQLSPFLIIIDKYLILYTFSSLLLSFRSFIDTSSYCIGLTWHFVKVIKVLFRKYLNGKEN